MDAQVEENPYIQFEDFLKVQLKVGEIVEAEKHPNADRLLALKVEVGEERPRSIVAGIAAKYAAEDLLGKKIVIVANLKPRKLRGGLSEGMLLAAIRMRSRVWSRLIPMLTTVLLLGRIANTQLLRFSSRNRLKIVPQPHLTWGPENIEAAALIDREDIMSTKTNKKTSTSAEPTSVTKWPKSTACTLLSSAGRLGGLEY